MIEKRIAIFLLVLLVCFNVVACGKKKGDEGAKEGPVKKEYFLKGEPDILLKGAKTIRESFLSEKNSKDFSNFYLAGVVFFSQYSEKVSNKKRNSAEEGNEAATSDESGRSRMVFSFSRSAEGDYVFKDLGSNIKFYFRGNERGSLDLYQFEAEGFMEFTPNSSSIVAVTPLHYSLKEDKSAFSILAETKLNHMEKTLMAFTFVKNYEEKDKVKLEKSDSKYKYLLGPGVRYAWSEKAKDLYLCGAGANSPSFKEQARKGVGLWNPLMSRYLSFDIKEKSDGYYPFSDLNQQCLYLIDDYLITERDSKFAVLGTTYVNFNLDKSSFVDADIFIWGKEFEKIHLSVTDSEEMTTTIAHEFGHLLGLDHQFDEYTNSIMGYDGYSKLSSYDVQALRHLYSRATDTLYYKDCQKWGFWSSQTAWVYNAFNRDSLAGGLLDSDLDECFSFADDLLVTESFHMDGWRSVSEERQLQYLSKLPRLKQISLKVSVGVALDMGNLSELPNLESLSIHQDSSSFDVNYREQKRLRLTNLSALQKFPKLSSLTIKRSDLKDLSFLQYPEMEKMIALNLDENLIDDISPLATLPVLKELSLKGNFIEHDKNTFLPTDPKKCPSDASVRNDAVRSYCQHVE